jgi:hypothetical protein
MDKTKLLDMALDMLGNDMDGMEGRAAREHSIDQCDDPLMCDMHADENGEALSGLGPDKVEAGDGGGVSIEVKKLGMPSMEAGGKAEESLDPEEQDALRKLLGK